MVGAMGREAERRIPFYRQPQLRGLVAQVLLCLVLGLVIYAAVQNASENLARAKIASGFGFWNVTSGFDISQTLIDYSPQASTNGDAFWVGLLNTLLVAGLGILFATAIGFAVGLARLSGNFLVERLATCYVELIRNVPLLLQLAVLVQCRSQGASRNRRQPHASGRQSFSTTAGCSPHGRCSHPAGRSRRCWRPPWRLRWFSVS